MNPFNTQIRETEIIRLDATPGGSAQNTNPAYYSDYRNLNIVDLDENATIYRIFDYQRFIQLLQNRRNTLVLPSLWQDPFENFLLGSRGIWHGTPVSFQPIRDSWYGQCWTFNKECDGMWRANTSGTQRRAVKVKTTVGRLFEGLYDFSNRFHPLSYFIGKVRYIDQANIQAFMQSAYTSLTDTTNIRPMLTLLTKRSEFAYENELRLLCHVQANNAVPPAIYEYDIDPNALFDEAVLDPWTSDAELQVFEPAIRNAGFANNIMRSDLYQRCMNTIVIP